MLNWSSDHRRHHENIDEDLDPYNIQKRGFLWAHIGWLMVKSPNPEDFSNVPDLVADPLVRFQHRFYVPLAIFMGFVRAARDRLRDGTPVGLRAVGRVSSAPCSSITRRSS